MIDIFVVVYALCLIMGTYKMFTANHHSFTVAILLLSWVALIIGTIGMTLKVLEYFF